MIDKGEALPSIPGRIDDYAWPPRSAEVPPMAEVLPQPPAAPATQTKSDAPTAADKPGVLTPISKAN
jgi:hypothetical protein